MINRICNTAEDNIIIAYKDARGKSLKRYGINIFHSGVEQEDRLSCRFRIINSIVKKGKL